MVKLADFILALFIMGACAAAGIEVGYLLSPSLFGMHMPWDRIFVHFGGMQGRLFQRIQNQAQDDVMGGGAVGLVLGAMVNLVRK